MPSVSCKGRELFCADASDLRQLGERQEMPETNFLVEQCTVANGFGSTHEA
jgi:hypothetical protein